MPTHAVNVRFFSSRPCPHKKNRVYPAKADETASHPRLASEPKTPPSATRPQAQGIESVCGYRCLPFRPFRNMSGPLPPRPSAILPVVEQSNASNAPGQADFQAFFGAIQGQTGVRLCVVPAESAWSMARGQGLGPAGAQDRRVDRAVFWRYGPLPSRLRCGRTSSRGAKRRGDLAVYGRQNSEIATSAACGARLAMTTRAYLADSATGSGFPKDL